MGISTIVKVKSLMLEFGMSKTIIENFYHSKRPKQRQSKNSKLRKLKHRQHNINRVHRFLLSSRPVREQGLPDLCKDLNNNPMMLIGVQRQETLQQLFKILSSKYLFFNNHFHH